MGDQQRAAGAAGRPRLGLVLGGTGVRGLAQAGALGALQRAGAGPDVVVGVSTGAIVAAAYAAREDWSEALQSLDRTKLPALAAPSGTDETLARLRATIRSARQLAPSVWTWGRQGYEQYGRASMATLLGDGLRFEDTRVPLAQVATDLQRGERAVLSTGHVATATLAASALPGVTRPLEIDGRILADGAFSDPVPVDVARDLGADIVVVVDPATGVSPADPENWMLALVRGIEIGQHAFAQERLREADLVVSADLGSTVRALDFAELETAVRRTATAVGEATPRIRALLGVT